MLGYVVAGAVGAFALNQLLGCWSGSSKGTKQLQSVGPASNSAKQLVSIKPGTNSDSPTVVLIHGFGCSSFEWEDIIPSLNEYTVFSYDRVVGVSGTLDQPRSCEILTSELKHLLLESGLNPPFILVGHSYGGLLAQFFALKFPKDVSGLVLIDPAHEEQFEKLPTDFVAAFQLVPIIFLVYRIFAPLGLIRILNFFGLCSFPPLNLYPRELEACTAYSRSNTWKIAAQELSGCLVGFKEFKKIKKTSEFPNIPITFIVACDRKRYENYVEVRSEGEGRGEEGTKLFRKDVRSPTLYP